MKKKRMVLIIGFALLLPILLYIAINVYAYARAAEEMIPLEKADSIHSSPDAILVLGAGVREDGTPSNMLEDRLLTALSLYQKGICDTVIVSGDHGRPNYDEVNVMKEYLVGKGIPSDRIFMDHAGFSTYDSIYRARCIFGVEEMIIVTQEYHAYRSLMIASALEIEAEAVPAPILSSDNRRYPKQSWYSLRESLARVKDFVFCLVLPEPAVLGEEISLEASGDITNDRV